MKPIIFNTEMVRAILEGRKTQTRRPVKGTALTWLNDGFTQEFVASPQNGFSPCGYAGDVLYVRETWAQDPEENAVVYKASENGQDWAENDEGWRWKPSIHMPKWAARIFLKVKAVRLERVQDISEADAWAEGINSSDVSPTQASTLYSDYASPRRAFHLLWDSVYDNWAKNPLVWVIEFERIDKPEAQP